MATIKFTKQMEGITLNKPYEIIERFTVDNIKYFKFKTDNNEFALTKQPNNDTILFIVTENEKEIE